MITKIGITAGEIWHLLDKKDKLELEVLVTTIDIERDIILMSIGWLAREGHILLEGDTPKRLVSLRKKKN